MKSDNRTWCATVNNRYTPCTGECLTREEAIQLALDDLYKADGTIEVGRCEPVDPARYCKLYVDTVLEDADESAGQEIASEDPLFELFDRKEAQAALDEFMKTWARKYVQPTIAWTGPHDAETLCVKDGVVQG